jgi:antitoxin component YwqK of YwqJK toxin-antitoxin module
VTCTYYIIFTSISKYDPKISIWFHYCSNKTGERYDYKQWFDKDSTMLQTEYSVVIIGQDTFRNGRSSEYFQNGNIKQSVNYDRGLMDGQVNAYFKNGFIMTEQSYSKGLLHGLSKDFYDNGKVKLEVTYEN